MTERTMVYHSLIHTPAGDRVLDTELEEEERELLRYTITSYFNNNNNNNNNNNKHS